MSDDRNSEVVKPDIVIKRVNRYYAGWHPQAIYNNFTTKVVLSTVPYIKALTRIGNFKKILTQKLGPEGEKWFAFANKGPDAEDQLYFANSTFMMAWKLENNDDFHNNVLYIEKHDDSLNKGEEVIND